jgi:hypothetical protein
MSRRIPLLVLLLLCLSSLAGAAVIQPANPTPTAPSLPAAAAAPAPAEAPAWLQPANSSPVEKPDVDGLQGAIFKSACSIACGREQTLCFNGCGGDLSCNRSCSDDYHCCVAACNPTGPQCP